ncbi:MAG: 30S ribosomal protein S20 [Thermotoga sp.]|nr:MAG: 30S ribosomal protein S20 [Thermotoga sp.]HDM70731.1 30S ribosomal protein S20 [Thermotogales bacterium]
MPNIKSAKKRVKTSERRRERNKYYKGRFKNLIKKMRKFIEMKDVEKVKELLPETISAIDKAAQKGAIHPNQAARRKSRIMKRVNELLKSMGS